MPRRSKGPRIWLHPARQMWFIRDTPNIQRGTGCDASDRRGAEIALAEYVRQKHTATIGASGPRDPSAIPVADVINLYLKDIAPHRSRPGEITDRLLNIAAFFTGTLDSVTGPRCRAYAAQRSTPAAARRELEDLRSAINHHRNEGLHDRLITVTLPPKSPRRERWLTRAEAATLIHAAWRYREAQGGPMAGRRTRRHVARFMLVCRYMGSRAAVICSASIEPKRPPGRAWVDLSTGIFYGRPAGEQETKKRKQTVRLPPPLLGHMRRWRTNGQRYVVEWGGEPVRSVSKAHRAVCRSCGMPDVTPHVWRHSVATWLLERGEPARSVADWLAMSEETLKRVYAHLAPGGFDGIHRAL